MAFSSFHLGRDAKEREQLTLVYLALSKGGDVTKHERELVINSIFSRSDTGLIKSEKTQSEILSSPLFQRFQSGGS